MFSWYRQVTPRERKTFWACFGGWSLDALEVQMFGLAIPALIAAFALTKGDAGLISGVTLVTSAIGGWVGGTLSDRYGRVRTLQWMILWFSVFTFLSAFVTGFNQLLIVKALQGFGIGGEWAAGAVLMAETINPQYRGKVMGTVQSAWAVGWGLAVGVFTLIYSFVPQDMAWRVMFLVGLLPSFLIIWVRRNVEEPDSFQRLQKENAIPQSFFKSLAGIFRPELIRVTLFGGLLGLGAHGGYHAVMTWLPTFLKTERNLSVLNSGGYLAVIIFAFWCGCVVSGFLIDRIGRRKKHRVVCVVLCRHRAVLCVPAADQYPDAVPGVSARLLRGWHSGESWCAVQRVVSSGRARRRCRFLLQLWPSAFRGVPVPGRPHERLHVLGVCNWHRRRGRLRCGGDRGTLPAGNPWAQSRGLDCAGANHGRRQRDRPGLMTITFDR